MAHSLSSRSSPSSLHARGRRNRRKDCARAVTFNGDIAPILFDNCASCHRPIDAASPLRRQVPPMIRSAWLARRSACSTTTRFVAMRGRSRQPCSAERCRRGCPSSDTACSPTNGGSATIRSRSSRNGSRAARPRGIRPSAEAADVSRRMATWHARSRADAAGGVRAGSREAATCSATSSFRCRSPRRAMCAPLSSAPIAHRRYTTRTWRSISGACRACSIVPTRVPVSRRWTAIRC